MRGVFHGHVSSPFLMVIDQLNVKGIIPLKAENDAPIGPNRHGPQPPQVAFEWVQAVAGEIQSLRRCGGIENREDSLNRIQEVGADPTSVAAFIEAFQASMLKAPNHQSYCKVIIVTCQFIETETFLSVNWWTGTMKIVERVKGIRLSIPFRNTPG